MCAWPAPRFPNTPGSKHSAAFALRCEGPSSTSEHRRVCAFPACCRLLGDALRSQRVVRSPWGSPTPGEAAETCHVRPLRSASSHMTGPSPSCPPWPVQHMAAEINRHRAAWPPTTPKSLTKGTQEPELTPGTRYRGVSTRSQCLCSLPPGHLHRCTACGPLQGFPMCALHPRGPLWRFLEPCHKSPCLVTWLRSGDGWSLLCPVPSVCWCPSLPPGASAPWSRWLPTGQWRSADWGGSRWAGRGLGGDGTLHSTSETAHTASARASQRTFS